MAPLGVACRSSKEHISKLNYLAAPAVNSMKMPLYFLENSSTDIFYSNILASGIARIIKYFCNSRFIFIDNFIRFGK